MAAGNELERLLTWQMGNGAFAFTTTRQGGVSTGNYATFNINSYCGDQPQSVESNRKALCKALGIDTRRLVMPHQTHGTEVADIGEDFLALDESGRKERLEGVDALATDMKKVCIGVSTADCTPIIIYDPVGKVAAAVHAGWRGTVGRIAQKAVEHLQKHYGARPCDMTAVVGPCISARHFEVGDEVFEAFQKAGFPMESIAHRQEKWHIDLKGCNVLQLTEAGVPKENITVSELCTWRDNDLLFSARRQGTACGRLFTGIIITG